MNLYTSFDFDHTLYDPENNVPIKETSKILYDLLETGKKVCITTLRGENETDKIKELFPDIPIFATNGFNKVLCLRKYSPVPITRHYDDDLNICVALANTSIKPVWVRGRRLREGIDRIEKLDVAI